MVSSPQHFLQQICGFFDHHEWYEKVSCFCFVLSGCTRNIMETLWSSYMIHVMHWTVAAFKFVISCCYMHVWWQFVGNIRDQSQSLTYTRDMMEMQCKNFHVENIGWMVAGGGDLINLPVYWLLGSIGWWYFDVMWWWTKQTRFT